MDVESLGVMAYPPRQLVRFVFLLHQSKSVTLYKMRMNSVKQLLILCIAICYPTIYCFSQKEIFFANTPKDSISIKSLQYFQVEARNNVPSHLTFPVLIGYAAENKITKSGSLITGANIVGGGYYRPENLFTRTQMQLGTSIQIYAEPRWYFGFKHRYLTGHNTMLNSGWFISTPIELCTSTLFLEPMKLNLTLTPSIGYRIAPSKQFFLEASIGRAIPLLPKSYGFIQFNLKAGYVFNTKK